MSFYSDYTPKKPSRLHTLIIILSHAYLEYSDFGYEQTVDLLADVVWC